MRRGANPTPQSPMNNKADMLERTPSGPGSPEGRYGDGEGNGATFTRSSSLSITKKKNTSRPSSNASNRVQVAVRVRPLSKYDGANAENVIRVDGNTINIARPGEKEKRYVYDHIFTEGQESVHESIGAPMLRDAFEGYNVCLFAYGQTGSGKTWSIQGGDTPQSSGTVPRFCEQIFNIAQEKLDEDTSLTIKISMSFVEIYNEKVRDLLQKKAKGQTELTSLEIHETPDRRTYVEGLSVHTVLNYERIQRLTEYGSAQRQVSETKMNEKSSRSHSIIQFYLSQSYDPPTPEKRDTESIITFVDLAGSERQSKTEASGQQFDESKNINRSLLMLGRALNSFSDGKTSHVPLRESKLTRLLSECFGGNSRTWMLACVSPSAFNYSETVSTLEYAQSAKAIINKAKVNSIQQRLELKELREQHNKLMGLFDAERQAANLLNAQLQASALELTQLRTENETLKHQVEALESTKTEVEQALMSARGEVDELKIKAQDTYRTVMPPSQPEVQMYIGRAKVSLSNIIDQTSNYLTIPLVSDMMDLEGPQPQLIVNIYPVDSKGCSTLTGGKRSGPQELLGHRVDFVVHIIGARGIPPAYSHCVYCKYVYKWAEKDSYKTADVKQCTDPEFDFKKRFAFSKMNQGLVDYFMSDNVITFEVIGEAKPPIVE